jgi:formylglycine-generating enzyme required for sulfatase activity
METVDYTDPTRPVESVSWEDAVAYCAALTEREREAGRIAANAVYRLPTEAEWEYACRAWTSTRFSYGDDPGYTNLTHYAWYYDNSEGQTHPVGQKLPNPWGLHDMHGNVWEWCQDRFDYYAGGIALDPQGPSVGSDRVVRGGSWRGWFEGAGRCRSAYRSTAARIPGSALSGSALSWPQVSERSDGRGGPEQNRYAPPLTTPAATSAPRRACTNPATALTSSASSSHLSRSA